MQTSRSRRRLGQADAAQYLGVDPRTLRRWTRLGLVPFFRLPSTRDGLAGARIRYDVGDLDRWLAARKSTRRAVR